MSRRWHHGQGAELEAVSEREGATQRAKGAGGGYGIDRGAILHDTGRGPRGNELAEGSYVLRLVAHPVAGDAGAKATTVDVPFTITGR